jgi:chemotaxis protein CheC
VTHSPLSDAQLAALGRVLHAGATEASTALSGWIGRPTAVIADAVTQLSLQDSTSALGEGDEPICFCVVELSGVLAGCMILAFDDPSGLALADLLLGQARGTATEWGEMETSAALETTNIVCCAYLNALSRAFPHGADSGAGDPEMVPTPPTFSRDYASSLLEFALIGQAVESDQVLLTRTKFQIDGEPVDWQLLLVPDAASMANLRALFPTEADTP